MRGGGWRVAVRWLHWGPPSAWKGELPGGGPAKASPQVRIRGNVVLNVPGLPSPLHRPRQRADAGVAVRPSRDFAWAQALEQHAHVVRDEFLRAPMCRVASFKPSQPQPDGRWFAVVPVLFLDFLVMALPGGILPIILNDHYGPRSYIIVGYAQSLKGMLAFIGAPIIGALSDVVGRKHLFLTCVLGTASPYAALGLGCSLDTHLVLCGLSGMLAATFPLAFAYICDVVPEGPARTSAMGSTIGFGLGMAFLLGPPLVRVRVGARAKVQG